ncbi:MAG: 5'-deoxynucleotidase, partial [Clostridia bacterium]|nr:5'-deoxynucleotidase [Clostridia bacterium]
EHSLEVAIVAHCLATLGNVRLGKNLDADHISVMALFHDCTEIITGDMPTPIKYYNDDIKNSYKKIEKMAAKELADMLPKDMRSVYEPLLNEVGNNDYERKIMKAADKISAYLKCVDEIRMGNDEFVKAKEKLEKAVKKLEIEEADIFMEEFAPEYGLSLYEL